MREKTIRKKGIILLSILFLIFAITGCSSTRLSDAFDEETVKLTAQTATDYLIAGEYGEIVAMMSDVTKESISEELLATNMAAMNVLTGAFKEYKSIATIGQKDSEGTEAAVAVIVAVFENRDVTYTISFNTNMEVIGLWMK